MNEQEFEELAAGHALHALSPDDERRFEEALAAHPERQDSVDRDEATVLLLADTTAEVAPPAALRDALLAAIAGPRDAADSDAERTASPTAEGAAGRDAGSGGPDVASGQVSQPGAAKRAAEGAAAPDVAAAPARRRRSIGSRGLFALAASLVVVLALGIGGIFVAREVSTPASTYALQQVEKQPDAQSTSADVSGGGTATVHWSSSLGKAVLVSDGLTPLPSDKAYEMWFVRGKTATPAGVFDAPKGESTAALDGTLHSGDTVAVTVEQSGGSPTKQPTTTPIVAIPTA